MPDTIFVKRVATFGTDVDADIQLGEAVGGEPHYEAGEASTTNVELTIRDAEMAVCDLRVAARRSVKRSTG